MSYIEKALEKVNKLIERSEEGTEEQIDYIVMQQACKKQVAKRVIIPSIGMLKGLARCPKCEVIVENGAEKFNYCPDCGQKLDWSL